MVQDLGKEPRLGIDPLVGDGGVGRRQLQVRYALGDAAKSRSRVVVRIGHGGNAEISSVFHAQLRRYRFHHAADGYNIHGVNDSVADRAVAHIALAAVPVPEGFRSHGKGSVIINGA